MEENEKPEMVESETNRVKKRKKKKKAKDEDVGSESDYIAKKNQDSDNENGIPSGEVRKKKKRMRNIRSQEEITDAGGEATAVQETSSSLKETNDSCVGSELKKDGSSALSCENESNEVPRKRKKEKRKRDVNTREEITVDVKEDYTVAQDMNNSLKETNDSCIESELKKDGSINTLCCEDELSEMPKKRKKKKKKELSGSCNVEEEKAKIKDEGDMFESESKDMSGGIRELGETNESVESKEKKKQKSIPSEDKSSDIISEKEQSGASRKRKKKKKKEKAMKRDDEGDSGSDQLDSKKEFSSEPEQVVVCDMVEGNEKGKEYKYEKSKKKGKQKERSDNREEKTGGDMKDDEGSCGVSVKKKKKSKHEDRSKDTLTQSDQTDKLEEKAKDEAGANQWGSADFGNTSQKEKFLRLMGAYKPSSKQRSTSNYSVMAMNRQQETQLSNSLEKQFLQALEKRKEKGVGLGFQ